MTVRNHYAVLGVARTADASAIREAYVRRLKITHPDLDRHDPRPKARLEDLQRAYHCLRDTASRAEHDAELAEAERARAAQVRRLQRRLAGLGSTQPPLRHPRQIAAARAASRWRALLVLGILAVASMRLAGL